MSNVYQKTEINDKEEIWIILWFLKVQCCSFEEDITKFSPIQCCCMVQSCRSRQKKEHFVSELQYQSHLHSNVCRKVVQTNFSFYAIKLYPRCKIHQRFQTMFNISYKVWLLTMIFQENCIIVCFDEKYQGAQKPNGVDFITEATQI